MSDEDLAERLAALERTVVGDGARDGTGDAREGNHREGSQSRPPARDELEPRVNDLEATVEELEAAVQAVRGYAGNIRAVNRDVERRASAALAKAEALEAAVGPGRTGGAGRSQEFPEGRSGQDRDLSREPTVIADSEPSASELTHSETTEPDGDGGSEGGPSDDQQREGTETDQFVERVRDAL
jgi:hypothetical protein